MLRNVLFRTYYILQTHRKYYHNYYKQIIKKKTKGGKSCVSDHFCYLYIQIYFIWWETFANPGKLLSILSVYFVIFIFIHTIFLTVSSLIFLIHMELCTYCLCIYSIRRNYCVNFAIRPCFLSLPITIFYFLNLVHLINNSIFYLFRTLKK